MTRRFHSIGIIAVIVLVALFALVPMAGAAPAAQTPTGTVDAADQPIVDGSITVASITSGQDGWIVAHLDEAGAPGKVIGQTQVKTGDSKDVKIKLSQDVPAGGKLWPMLHIDAGTAGTYEFPGADVPVVVSGNVVMKQIAVTASAPAAQAKDAVDVSDQPLKNGSITVASVTATVDGWIVAHLDEGGAPGKVLGQTAVKAGENKNVAIKLSENVPSGGKLWPMLHIDAGTAGTYEFPGADVPVSVGGNIVMKQISVTAGAPTGLPRTGGDDGSNVLLVSALALLLGGALLTLRMRRHA
jgi:LPXTG-motif cell wall-anchored protein